MKYIEELGGGGHKYFEGSQWGMQKRFGMFYLKIYIIND